MRLVAYERVSTARQGQSGLGLEAQRRQIAEFAAAKGAAVLARFTEVESGRKADRPELAKALHHAKVTGATLVIAKLDRLSPNAAFLLALRYSGVKFVAVDMPEANDLTVGRCCQRNLGCYGTGWTASLTRWPNAPHSATSRLALRSSVWR